MLFKTKNFFEVYYNNAIFNIIIMQRVNIHKLFLFIMYQIVRKYKYLQKNTKKYAYKVAFSEQEASSCDCLKYILCVCNKKIKINQTYSFYMMFHT